MKTVVLILSFLVGFSVSSWADETAHTILGGIVKSITQPDLSKGTDSEMTVKDGAGKTTIILVAPTTTLWDADEKAIMADKIIVRKHVNVIYLTTSEGVNVGKSIKLLN
jgi:hypothetical protein